VVLRSTLAVPVALALTLSAAGEVRAASPVLLAQVVTEGRAAITEARARALSSARQSAGRLAVRKRSLRRVHDQHTAAIEKLARQRASWNRDRKIANLKASAQATAKQLTAIDRQLAAARREMVAAQRQLLAAARRELEAGVEGGRARQLRQLETSLARALRPPARKIIVPDEKLDPLADPEELEELARLIARAEAQLRAEERKLERQVAYFRNQQRLRTQRDRARDIERLDGEGVRRTTGIGAASDRASGADSASPEADDGGGLGGSDGESPPDNQSESPEVSLETSSVVLADVIDDVTAADLRRASRSTNPALRARAASRAQREVQGKLRQLRRQQQLIRRRVDTLRN
jgi:hypothetical protein